MKYSRSIAQVGVLSAVVLSLAVLEESPWQPDTNGIHFRDANVGIGVNSSSNSQLSVRGDRAIFARSDSRTGRGVFGLAHARRGNNFGVYGQSRSNRGRGVLGLASATSGNTYGVYGESRSTDGDGVFGEATATSGITFGVHGVSQSPQGFGVFGRNTAATGSAVGVQGVSPSPQGRGVLGVNTAATGSGPGVLGISGSVTGVGLSGLVLHGTGINIAVQGISQSTAGFDFFAGGMGTDYGASSSRRWKNNIENIDRPLEKIARLRGVYFDWNEDHGGQHDVGMIAEEVGAVMPEIVQYEENGIDAIGMDYGKMTPLLVEAVNALRAEKDSQLAKRDEVIQELQDRLAQLELLVAQLVTERP